MTNKSTTEDSPVATILAATDVFIAALEGARSAIDQFEADMREFRKALAALEETYAFQAQRGWLSRRTN